MIAQHDSAFTRISRTRAAHAREACQNFRWRDNLAPHPETVFTPWALLRAKLCSSAKSDTQKSDTQRENWRMTVCFSDRRLLLRFMLVIIAVAVGWGRAAAASEITAPVEQLHAGLMSIMKAGKTASFRQRYETIAPVIGQTFDLEVILRQVVGPRWASLPADQQAALAD